MVLYESMFKMSDSGDVVIVMQRQRCMQMFVRLVT